MSIHTQLSYEAAFERLTEQGDPVAVAVLATLGVLEAELTEEGWDQQHRLYAMKRRMASLGGRTEAILLEVSELRLFSALDDGPAVARELHRLAQTVRARPAVRRGELFGWVLVTEGWMVVGPDDDSAVSQEVMQAAYDHRLSERPDRIEVRVLQAVDRSGTLSQLTRERDGDLSVLITDGGRFQVGGDIPAGLSELMEACA